MSFPEYKDTISLGDTVILYLGFNNMKSITVTEGEMWQGKYGGLRHEDMIGKKYGTQIKCTKGWVYALQATPELWTQTLPHRTQILYSTDISMITLQLELKPGAVVVESGTGSGSLSHAILRSIAPSGHLHTFDFHEARADQARQEFRDHGFGDVVTVKHRDVCAKGFDLSGVADAVFLDLPAPWDAIPHAKEALKSGGGRICSFSPCIEQVQRACIKLTELGFKDINTCECLLREYSVYSCNMNVAEGWQGYPDLHPSLQELDDQTAVGSVETTEEDSQECSALDNDNEEARSNKRKRGGKKTFRNAYKKTAKPHLQYKFQTAIPKTISHGHTGFLTFATLLPRVRSSLTS